MLFSSLQTLSFLILLFVLALILTLVVKKSLRDYHVLVEEKEKGKYRSLLESWICSNKKVACPLSIEERERARAIIEKLLVEFMRWSEDADRRIRIRECFELLGYYEECLAKLDSKRSHERGMAAYLLGELDCKQALDKLIPLLCDRSRDVKFAALRSVCQIGSAEAFEVVVKLLHVDKTVPPERVAEVFNKIDRSIETEAIRILDLDDEDVRVFAAQFLARAKSECAQRALEKAALYGLGVDTRARALSSLGLVGGRKSIPVLKNCFGDSAWEVRAQAAKAAGLLGAKSLSSQLSRCLSDKQWWVRHNGAQALGKLGLPGRRALEKSLDSHDRFAREASAEALQGNGVVDQYIDKYVSNDSIRSAGAQRVLKKLISAGVTSRIEERLMLECSDGLRRKLVELLNTKRDKAMVE